MLLSALFISGCTAQTVERNSSIRIEIIKVDSWLNLMPGGPSSYHIAGEVKITNEGEEVVDSLYIDEISVYQNDHLIYKINPFIEAVPYGEDNFVKPGTDKVFLFGTRPGLRIKDELDTEVNIKAEFRFKYGTEITVLSVEDIKIEKAY